MASWGLWAGWRGGGAWGYEKEKPPASGDHLFPAPPAGTQAPFEAPAHYHHQSRGPNLPRPPPDAASLPGKFLLSEGNSTEVRLTRCLLQPLLLRPRKPPPASGSPPPGPDHSALTFLLPAPCSAEKPYPARQDRTVGERCAQNADVFLFVRVGFCFLH